MQMYEVVVCNEKYEEQLNNKDTGMIVNTVRGSSLISSQPSKKSGRFDKRSSPRAVFIIRKVFTAELPNFTQNFVAILFYNERCVTTCTRDENVFHAKTCPYSSHSVNRPSDRAFES